MFLQNVEEELPYSLDIFLGAAEDMYDVIDISEALDDATLFEDDGWKAYVAATLAAREEQKGGQEQFDPARFDQAKMDASLRSVREKRADLDAGFGTQRHQLACPQDIEALEVLKQVQGTQLRPLV